MAKAPRDKVHCKCARVPATKHTLYVSCLARTSRRMQARQEGFIFFGLDTIIDVLLASWGWLKGLRLSAGTTLGGSVMTSRVLVFSRSPSLFSPSLSAGIRDQTRTCVISLLKRSEMPVLWNGFHRLLWPSRGHVNKKILEKTLRFRGVWWKDNASCRPTPPISTTSSSSSPLIWKEACWTAQCGLQKCFCSVVFMSRDTMKWQQQRSTTRLSLQLIIWLCRRRCCHVCLDVTVEEREKRNKERRLIFWNWNLFFPLLFVKVGFFAALGG